MRRVARRVLLIDTTTHFVEHPRVVARRIEEAVDVVGDRER